VSPPNRLVYSRMLSMILVDVFGPIRARYMAEAWQKYTSTARSNEWQWKTATSVSSVMVVPDLPPLV